MKRDQGERDLQTLLKQMQPVLEEGDLVFCSLPPNQAEDYLSLCQGYVVEPEGITVIIGRSLADRNNLPYDLVFRRLSLMVHSSLDAVGFLARITEILAAQGISVNVVSGYYHDHLYIVESRAKEALKTLKLWQKKLSE
ncbi:MAG: ACT domain-containing protein [Anaerolineales bacterium]|nr:ACT domain-containing protein [Anaerolineales bacterium]